MSESFTFFWAGPFSQWHKCRFEVDGIVYNCAEQFMMAEKARLFGDKATEVSIMLATEPKEHKKLGREVKNFDPQRWTAAAKSTIYRGNEAKFSQNKALFDLFMTTRGTTLVEASPYDTIYGIGLAASDPRAKNRALWRGQNVLGETLTELREDLAKNFALST